MSPQSSFPTGFSGELVAVCTSAGKGTTKQRVDDPVLAVRGHGIEGDAHAGSWHRQVSLLADEQIEVMRQKGLDDLEVGAFGENLVTRGIDLDQLAVGRRLRVGDGADGVVLQLTQRGKVCHDRCAIYHRTGDCIMPRHGLFARVLRSGELAAGMPVTTDAALDRPRYAVVTLSDSRARAVSKQKADAAGDAVCELLETGLPTGLQVGRRLLADDRKSIERELTRLCDEAVCDLVVTTGGTGLSPRDVTPEATLAVIDREIPGMAEAMRAAGMAKTPRAMLSRAVCGQRGSTIIVNLSGSPKAVREQLEVLLPALPHAIEVASGVPQDCAR